MNVLHPFVAIYCFLAISTIHAGTTEVADSESGDHKYRIEVVSPAETDADKLSAISLVSVAGDSTVDSFSFGGYAPYPQNAAPANLAVSWSPSSRHLALMIRDAKRSWSVSVYSASDSGLLPINLPSATSRALKVLGVESVFRVARERPLKWTDKDELVVRASGDTSLNGKIVWFEVDVVYSISKQSITDARLISRKKNEG